MQKKKIKDIYFFCTILNLRDGSKINIPVDLVIFGIRFLFVFNRSDFIFFHQGISFKMIGFMTSKSVTEIQNLDSTYSRKNVTNQKLSNRLKSTYQTYPNHSKFGV